MKILVEDGVKVHKIYITKEITETYVIAITPLNYNKEILLTIDIKNDKKVIKSNGSVSLIENDIVVNDSELKENKKYILKIDGTEFLIYLYTFPIYDKNFFKMSLNNLEKFSIGRDKSNNISYDIDGIENSHVQLTKNNSSWLMTCSKNVYRNNFLVTNCEINVGDTIFLNGLKIIWMNDFVVLTANHLTSLASKGLTVYNDKSISREYSPVTEDESYVEFFSECDYFFHTPRLREIISKDKFVIDPPPAKAVREEIPFWLSIGSSLTMLASSFMMSYNVYYGLSTGTRTLASAVPQIVMCVALLIGGIIMPKILNAYRKRLMAKNEKIRQVKYSEYLVECERKISNILKNEKSVLHEEAILLSECEQVISSKNRHFWSRNYFDDDFLSVVLGIGDIAPLLNISIPDEHFEIETDNLVEKVRELKNKYIIQKEMPISYSFKNNKFTALIGNKSNKYSFISNLIVKLATIHSPNDLKIIILTNESNHEKWKIFKNLPHCFSKNKDVRFFACNHEQAIDINRYLSSEIKTSNDENINTVEDESYLIITDNYQKYKKLSSINNLVNNSENSNLSLIICEDTLQEIPSECNHFIVYEETKGYIFGKNLSRSEQISFEIDISNVNIDLLINSLFNIPINEKEKSVSLPDMLTFLDMFGVSKIEHLNIPNKWKTNNPVNSLSTVVGVNTSGDGFKLNLHEKEHGPHGLIAGMTGSGKSEFILTYILSMAINYHPYEVQFVLIDYKGGGLAGAFENKEMKIRLPHLVGIITNLDSNEINRTLVSIYSEVRKRQVIFNETREKLNEGIIDIYKYQKLYREGLVEKPLAHLFIISDEFAELKSQQPDFMNELISIARIGRSLGVHLILATQKPTGVVNDQIWSNSKFKISFKVQNKSDSNEILKEPDAASIREAGRFYMKVGYDDFFDVGQSGWAGAKYNPVDKIIKKVDNTIDFIDNVGNIIVKAKDYDTDIVDSNQKGNQLTNVVSFLSDLGVKENLYVPNLWLPKIPAELYINELKSKYNYISKQYYINPIIGEYDIPEAQNQKLLNLDLTVGGNTIINGQSGSGKENLLTTIIWSSVTEHTPDEVNFYIIDCGSESLKKYYNMPHVGDILGVSDGEKISALIDQLYDEIEERKKLFLEYSGSYIEFVTNSDKKLPLITVVINEYDSFVENFYKLSETMQALYRDGAKYGIVFIISLSGLSTIRGKMLSYFNNTLVLKLTDSTNYRVYFGTPKNLVPADIFGRGIAKVNNNFYEFQSASICNKDSINNTIKAVIKQYNNEYTNKAKEILMIPSNVSFDLFKKDNFSSSNIPVGYDIKHKIPFTFNFSSNKIINIVSNNINESKMSFIYGLVSAFKKISVGITVLDFVDAYERKEKFVNIVKSDFENNFIKIYNEIIENNNVLDNPHYYVVLGAGHLYEKLSSTKNVLDKLFNELNNLDNVYFIFVDTYVNINKLPKIENVNKLINYEYGIWLGDNIQSQMFFDLKNDINNSDLISSHNIAYFIDSGKYNIVKFMSGGSNNE